MPELKKRYPIESIAVFGSYARNEANENSDVDLLVKFNGKIGWEINLLASELESLLGKKVDLVSSDGIRKPYWKEHILKLAIYV